MEVIDSNTLVPIGLIIMIAGSVIGAVVWLTNLHSLAKETAKRVDDLENDMKSQRELHVKNGERLAKIETLLADLPDIKSALVNLTTQLARSATEMARGATDKRE